MGLATLRICGRSCLWRLCRVGETRWNPLQPTSAQFAMAVGCAHRGGPHPPYENFIVTAQAGVPDRAVASGSRGRRDCFRPIPPEDLLPFRSDPLLTAIGANPIKTKRESACDQRRVGPATRVQDVLPTGFD